MTPATAALLRQINRRFYEQHAESFSDTRAQPWQGFSRALETVGSAAQTRVLDVGCGNGRLVPVLRARFGSALVYRGIDGSSRLLDLARTRHPEGRDLAFEQLDFLDGDPDGLLPEGPFELVVLLAVLHHVPSELRRQALVRACVRRLAPDGRLVLTFWRFDSDPRFAQRQVSTEELSRLAPSFALDPSELEPGDCFLHFGAAPSAIRYCHFPSEAEIVRLLGAGEVLERFFADGVSGRLNEYALLRAR